MENVVFLVLDSLRSDHLTEHAPVIAELAEDNLLVEDAVAPSRWSLPSHASMFSGLPPHEHGLYEMEHAFDDVSLVERMNERGYATYGVSSNPFCSGAYGFADPFDDFRYTLGRRLPEGLDVGSVTGSSAATGDSGSLRRYGAVIRAALGHDETFASLYNLAVAAIEKSVHEIGWLERLPHPLFQASDVYSYDPERNTRSIERYLGKATASDEPCFVFANYMDTHRPYYPSRAYQRQKLDRTLSFREIKRLNEGLGHPQTFAARDAAGTVDEEGLERVRSLYAGTVSEVDAHVERLFRTLERHDLRDETLVVITADHGEALGETGPRGHRRIGHLDTVSDHVLRVPLLFVHPSLEPADVQGTVPLTRVYDVIAEEIPLDSSAIGDRLASDGPVVAECLATGNTWDEEDQHGLPKGFERRQTREHTCVAYEGSYAVAMDTAGDCWRWKGDDRVDADAVPTDLEEVCRARLETIEETLSARGDDLSGSRDPDVETQLGELGYL